MGRRRGPSVRLQLTLSYAGFLTVAGALLLGAVWLFLLRYVPDGSIDTTGGFVPNRSDLLRAFGPAAGAVLGFLLLFGLLGGWLLSGRMLAPLTRITDAARIAADGSLSHRVDLDGRQDELRELADAFDTMLGRVQAQLAEQQRFAANASHELRTPLAITRTLLDVARDDPGRDVDAVLTRLQEVNTRAIDLTEALLLLSRADARAFSPEPVDVSLLAEEAAETVAPLAATRDVVVHLGDLAPGRPDPVLGSPTLLLQLTTNLVHNAVVHNRDTDGAVWVGTARRDGAVDLTVANTGPELPEQLVATLTEPFQRGSGRTRAVPGAGVGLGLAIVSRIVRAHDGTLTVAARPGGGLQVTVSLPTGPATGPAVRPAAGPTAHPAAASST